MSDRASKALAEASLPGEPRTYDATSKRSGVPLSTLYYRDHGRPSKEEKAEGQQYLHPAEEKALATYLNQMADLVNPVRIKYLPSLAFSIARRRSTTKVIKPPNKNWAQAFQKRHPELKSRRMKAMDWNRHEKNIYDKIIDWFEVIGKVLNDPAILQENVYNMDETGVMLCMLNSVKVLVSKDDKRDYRGAGVKRTTVTAIECISGNGRSLLPMIIWPATTHRSNWTTFPTPGWHYACTESGYTDSKVNFEWLKRVFDPQTKGQADQKPRVLISDGFGTHETLEVLEFCFENNITLCRLPSHTTHKLQPCDVGVFAPLKDAYRDEVERLYRGGVNTIGKEHFTSVYHSAREKAFTKRNITSAWAACGLFPLNANRVLRKTPKPASHSTVQGANERANEMEAGLYQQDEVPQTPVTPVTADGLMSLHNLIKQDTTILTETSIPRLQRHVQKLANAGQRSIAYCALVDERNSFLMSINNEAKVRRSTTAVVLGKGKGKVMSYEDLEEARAKRAAKDAMKGKEKRGRKRKNTVLEVDDPEAEPEEAHAAKELHAKRKRGRKRKSVVEAAVDTAPESEPEPEVARTIEASVSWRAPVAHMY